MAAWAFSCCCLGTGKILLSVVKRCFHLLKTALFCFSDNWNCLTLCSGSRNVTKQKKCPKSFSAKSIVDLKYCLQKRQWSDQEDGGLSKERNYIIKLKSSKLLFEIITFYDQRLWNEINSFMGCSLLWRKIAQTCNYSHEIFLLSKNANFVNCCKEYVYAVGNFNCIKTTKL